MATQVFLWPVDQSPMTSHPIFRTTPAVMPQCSRRILTSKRYVAITDGFPTLDPPPSLDGGELLRDLDAIPFFFLILSRILPLITLHIPPFQSSPPSGSYP